jgi:hypothetical protein
LLIMSDSSDPVLKILIEGDAAGVVAASGQAKDALAGVAGASSIPDEAPQSVEKLTLGHRQLALMVQRLAGRDFPELGHAIGSVAFGGPSLAAIFVAVGALEMVRRAAAELNKEIAALEFPDLQPPDAAKINEAADAMERLNTAVRDSVQAYGESDAATARRMKELTAEFDMRKKILEQQRAQEEAGLDKSAPDYAAKKKAMDTRYKKAGLDIGVEEDTQTEAEIQRHKLELKREAETKSAEAAKIKLGTPEQEAALDAQYKASADKARENKKTAKEERERLDEIREQAASSNLIDNFKAGVAQTGLLKKYGTLSPNAVEKLLDDMTSASDSAIQMDTERQKSKPARDREIARRKKLEDDAIKAADEAAMIDTGTEDRATARANKERRASTVAGTTSTSADKEAAQAIREAAISIRIFGDETKLAAVALRIEADKASGNVKDLNAALDWKARLEADLKALGRIVANQRSLF